MQFSWTLVSWNVKAFDYTIGGYYLITVVFKSHCDKLEIWSTFNISL